MTSLWVVLSMFCKLTMSNRRSLVVTLEVVLISVLTRQVTATVTSKLYKGAGLRDKSFTGSIVFTSPVRSLLHCAVLCRTRESCLTFTFDHGDCRGHSVKVTSNTPATYIERARSYVELPRKCESSDSGVITIYPADNTPLQVYCDSDTVGGGWLVFQRRQDGSVNFYRNWTEYQRGFGDLNGEFWLGLDALHMLTSKQSYTLRVDLMKFDGTRAYAIYSNFSISDSSDNYRLHYGSFIEGNAGNSMGKHNNYEFSTYDADHDALAAENCATRDHGAWWYSDCHNANLNGRYKPTRVYNGWDAIVWYSMDDFYSLQFSEMKIR